VRLRGHKFYDVYTVGEGSQAQVDACGRGDEGSSPMWTSTEKIKNRVHWCHPVMQRSWCLFTRISSFDGI